MTRDPGIRGCHCAGRRNRGQLFDACLQTEERDCSRVKPGKYSHERLEKYEEKLRDRAEIGGDRCSDEVQSVSNWGSYSRVK